MSQKLVPCKICGKPFAPCHYCEEKYGQYNWRAVACCEKHGRQYFHDVMVARGLLSQEKINKRPGDSVRKPLMSSTK
nr:MAG TPA: hypothetical protein [Caudoviricetes sp.]